MFGFDTGGGGFQNSSSSTADAGDGMIGGVQFGGISNGSRGVPAWAIALVVAIAAYALIKK